MNKKFLSLLSFLAVGAAVNAAPKKDIVDVAVEAGSFKTLVAAVKAADLVDTLKSDGPFTVFAPTDEAFAKLPKGTVETLLKPENKKILVDILTYHVVGDKVKAKKAVKLDSATTVNGQDIQITKSGDRLMINNSTVVAADIKASNGIIHVIDQVLLPETKKSASNSTNTNHIIQQAIHKGAPMFNSGHHEMTAMLYMKAGMDILNQCSSSRCPEASKTISAALKQASAEHCNTSRAWIMRKAFDKVLTSSI
jgi:transforming growth factor-beta-induced protein